MALLLVDHKAGFAIHPIVDALQPMIEPTHGVFTPFDHGAVGAVVGPRVVPRPEPGMDGRRYSLEHACDAIAVPVLQSADQEARNVNVLEFAHRSPPELAVPLMSEVIERPGRRVHARG